MAEGYSFPCWRCGLAGFTLLALTALPVQAQTRVPMTFGDIEITLQSVPQGSGWHGYCEYVFRVRNLSAERPHTVGLSMPFEKYYSHGDYIRDLRRTVPLGPNETVRVSLLQPDHPPIGGRNVAVFLDGQRRERDLQLKPNETQSGHPYRFRYGASYAPSGGLPEPLLLIGTHVGALPKRAPIALGRMPGGPMPGMAGGGPPGMPPGMGRPPRPARGMGGGPPPGMPFGEATEALPLSSAEDALPCHGALADMVLAWESGEVDIAPGKPGLAANSYQPVNPEDVETWSGHWLAYSRYDGVLVTADELKTMPASARAALWQYVETGGCLVVIGPADLHGLSAVAETTTDRAGWRKVRAGFGQCLVSPDNHYDRWDAEHFEMLSQAWNTTLAPWQGSHRGTAEANQEFPVVEDLGIPVKGLFVLMFLFVLGIGPINFLLLSRLKRRIWLLWTTPLISLATCLAVFGYMLLSEGWQGRLRTETLTLLDETTHRATTLGWTGVYSPLTPGDGLHFSYETEVVPQRFFEGGRGAARSCTLDWSQDQHFAAGWVEARVPALFKVRKSEMRRERVALQREADGRWSLVNGLGVAIQHFWYADDKGQMHAAEDIAPGARAMLTRGEKESQAPTVTVQSILSGVSWMNGMQQLAANPQRYLRPNTYLAEVDDSPFLEDALRNAKKRQAHALVVGFRPHGE